MQTDIQKSKLGFASSPMERLSRIFLWSAAVLLVLSMLDGLRRAVAISEVFFWRQDLAILVAMAIGLVLVSRAQLGWIKLPSIAAAPPSRIVLAAALAAVAIAWAGTFLTYDDYTLSMDEFMARFDAAIFGAGRLFGEIPREWASYRQVLHTHYPLDTPSPTHWSSSYLPVNAAFRAAAHLVRLESLVNPAFVGISVVATYGVARRLWPDSRQTGLVAALFVATSSQVLVNGMTSYAMPGHLALNLVWLWCFLRGDKAGHAGAILVGAVASGLHQVIFHPLFVAPFVLQLWIERRWALAGLYTFAYAFIAFAWIAYWQIGFELAGLGEAAAQSVSGTGGFLRRVLTLLGRFDITNVLLMAKNFVRFAAWQNPLCVALALAGGAVAVREGGPLRSMALGVVLCTVAMLVVLPSQQHGWGYRYLHGMLGSVCLIAAWTWTRAVTALAPDERGRMDRILVLTCALSILVLLPIRLWQVNRWVHPYAMASRLIERSSADIVVVDETGLWYAVDLVRNDPFLRNRPIVLRLQGLSPKQLTEVCGRGTVSIFDAVAGRAVGFQTVRAPAPGPFNRRATMAQMGCGTVIPAP